MADKMIYLSGLWLNESKEGKKFMAGYLGSGGRILIFKNDKKTKESDPDYHMMLAPKDDPTRGDADAGTDNIPF